LQITIDFSFGLWYNLPHKGVVDIPQRMGLSQHPRVSRGLIKGHPNDKTYLRGRSVYIFAAGFQKYETGAFSYAISRNFSVICRSCRRRVCGFCVQGAICSSDETEACINMRRVFWKLSGFYATYRILDR
jgi:hypothetical protein